MYYPKHQIKVELTSKVGQIRDKAGNIIKDLNVITTGDGKIYRNNASAVETGVFDNIEQLERIETGLNQVNFNRVSENRDIDTVFEINPADIEGDTVIRYFYYNKALNTVVELDRKSAIEAENRLVPYKILAEAKWTIKGYAEDQIIRGKKYEGLITRNTKEIERVRNIIPIITRKLNDPLEYTQVIPPTEETEGNKYQNTDKFYIPSPSKKL